MDPNDPNNPNHERQVARSRILGFPVHTVELADGKIEHRILSQGDSPVAMIVGTELGANAGVSYSCRRCGAIFEVDGRTPVAVSNAMFNTHLLETPE